MNGYLIAARDGVDYGKQLVGALMFWFPRGLWPGKPLDTGIYIANGRGYRFTNLSAPLWIEFFLNGGWILLVVGMCALGFFLHRWDSRLDRQLETFRMPTVLGCIVPFYLMILLRGSLIQAVPYLFFAVVVASFISTGRPRRPTRQTVRAPVGADPPLGQPETRKNHV
jgi:hypothetical protein